MIRAIAWDFDGVLNKNIVDGRFIWADTFEEDFGQSLSHLTQFVFGTRLDDIITGREDLRDRLTRWVAETGCSQDADALLAYWFAKDALPDPEVLTLLERMRARGVHQVIATNNEARRSRYIMDQMGFGARVDVMFASGVMGVRKPDPKFFHQVQDALSLPADQILLVDDTAENTEAAALAGWQSFHFTDATRDQLPAVLEAGVPLTARP